MQDLGDRRSRAEASLPTASQPGSQSIVGVCISDRNCKCRVGLRRGGVQCRRKRKKSGPTASLNRARRLVGTERGPKIPANSCVCVCVCVCRRGGEKKRKSAGILPFGLSDSCFDSLWSKSQALSASARVRACPAPRSCCSQSVRLARSPRLDSPAHLLCSRLPLPASVCLSLTRLVSGKLVAPRALFTHLHHRPSS